ncbi:hypothetical protein KL909_004269 [Ogataea angusta]|nr:hypothetical protein KL909_004269 [Ogataea angusta]
MRDIIVFSGSSNPELTDRICRNLGLPPGQVELKKFANGETSVHFGDSVREKDVFIVQSGAGHVNDLFMQLLIMISACKMASAKRITVVCPLFFYSRQVESQASKRGVPGGAQHRGSKVPDSVPPSPKLPSRASVRDPSPKNVLSQRAISTSSSLKTLHTNEASIANPTGYRSWIAQSGTLIANLLTSAGANHIITMDLHDAQFQGFFDIPVDNLLSKPGRAVHAVRPDPQRAPAEGRHCADAIGAHGALEPVHIESQQRQLRHARVPRPPLAVQRAQWPARGRPAVRCHHDAGRRRPRQSLCGGGRPGRHVQHDHARGQPAQRPGRQVRVCADHARHLQRRRDAQAQRVADRQDHHHQLGGPGRTRGRAGRQGDGHPGRVADPVRGDPQNK